AAFHSSFKGIENPRVLGSIPSPGTKFISTDLHGGPFFVSERHNLSIPPPNQFYRTQPDSPQHQPHCVGIIADIPQFDGICTLFNAFRKLDYGTD
ncbi:hypothetical protein ACT8MX_001855, partial [Escherichia albertii]